MGKTVAETLLALQLLPLQITLRAQTPIQLPHYKGSALRGGFGAVFKETVCIVEHRDCARCLLRARCAYPYVFDKPVPDGATRMRKYEAAPHPFVILPPLERKTSYQPGETLTFGWTLSWKYCPDEEGIETPSTVLAHGKDFYRRLEVLP